MTRPPLPSTWRPQYVGGMRGRCIGPCETTPNRGQIPDYSVKRNGGQLGEFWCQDLACATARDTLGAASPWLLSGSCEQQRQHALKHGAHRTRAQFDAARAADPLSVAAWMCWCIGPDDAGKPHAHHACVVGDIDDTTGELTVTGPRGGWLVCEGNAADPTKPASRNGDGAYHGRERGHPDDHTLYEFGDPEAFPP